LFAPAASNQDPTAPTGCVNVRLQIDHEPELEHEELPVSLNTDDHGREIPVELKMFLEKIKKQYLSHMDAMQVSHPVRFNGVFTQSDILARCRTARHKNRINPIFGIQFIRQIHAVRP
jgi:hypothetical protein